ncbi:hypothetical protein Q1M63_03125 (plasmid) [Sinorhizobium meliloti]|nr:hypothetical protein Q1M63_03125 [Sinorhizobium meliloti]
MKDILRGFRSSFALPKQVSWFNKGIAPGRRGAIHVRLDVSQDITHVCVIGSDGKIVWQGTCLSTPEAFRAPSKPGAEYDRDRTGERTAMDLALDALKAEGLPIA